MSAEFREIGLCHFMWEALDRAAAGDRGGHGVSQALQDIYRALAPLELAAARYERNDSGFEEPAMALISSIEAAEAAFAQIGALGKKYAAIAEAALAASAKPPTLPQ